jgi:thioesterase domain-containing protein
MRSTQIDTPSLESLATKPWAGEVVILPTTLAQQRFWFYDREAPGDPAYNIAVRFRLKGTLDVATLERATNEIVRRHEMLRTVFAEGDGEPVQLIAPVLTISLTVVDLGQVPAEERPAEAEEIAVREARTRFELCSGPLIRFVLLQLEPTEHNLLVTVHQTVSDCWSMGIISHELGVLYNAFFLGEASPLPELPIQYGDYAIWQKQSRNILALEDQLSYWTRQLADLPLLEVPIDRSRPAKKTSNGQIKSILLPKPLTEVLKDVSHRQGCTFFMLSLAALKILLRHLTGQSDIFVGTITAGRSRVDLEPLIGRFINPLVVRTDLSGDPTFLELLANVRERVLEALDNRDIPYECVIEALRPEIDPSRHPLFQINFVHQRAFVRPLELSSVSLSGIPSKSAGAIYDLYFFMVERAEGWRLSCEYNTDLYEPATVEQMLTHFRSILHSIADNPSRTFSELVSSAISDIETGPSSLARTSLVAAGGPDRPTLAPRPFVAPRNGIEARLAELWCRVVGSARVSINSDFFDDGGHSVLAARLLHLVELEYGKRLSLSAFLRTPTIELMARRIAGTSPPEPHGPLIPLRTGGAGPALFLVHDGFGETILYRNLARRLPEGVAVHGIEPLSTERCPIMHTRIRDMASHYVGLIREVQPRGPYALGGECVGGTIAFEMALQLEAQGEEVAFVALFDAADPQAAKQIGRVAGKRWASFSQSLKADRGDPPLQREGGRLLRAAKKIKNVALYSASSRAMKLASRVRFMRLRAALDRGLPVPRLAENLPVASVISFALKSYIPSRLLEGRAVLFRATEGSGADEPFLFHYNDPLFGWGRRARSELDVCDMPGGHSSMLQEPHVAVMAERLTASLQPMLTASQLAL